MLAKYTLGALIAVMAHGATAKFSDKCSWWHIGGGVTLIGICVGQNKTDPVTTNLDLNKCIGVDKGANAMIWEPNGWAFREKGPLPPFCGGCVLQSDLRTMQCECMNNLGGKTSSSINLNSDDRITVDEGGQLIC
ncbi:hypothetical protein FJTKL_06810 [Diaporthe vaccinii]|uniref:Cyanovirin-N domain-containing protein n=1 Tax=Diaporthe vaccinii TaxID=105482 RepID=A0ABR4EVF4_9PEZI